MLASSDAGERLYCSASWHIDACRLFRPARKLYVLHDRQSAQPALRRGKQIRCCVGDSPLPRAAKIVTEQFVSDGMVLGLGSGSMAAAVIEELVNQREQGRLQRLQCIPGTDSAAVEAAVQGLPLSDPDEIDRVDLMFSEVDEVDKETLACIIGRNPDGEAPVQLPIPRLQKLLSLADHFVALVSDENKVVNRLTGDLPVFVLADDWETTAEELDDRFLGDAEIWRRPSKGKSNPRGGDFPYLSSTGEHIVDIKFGRDAVLDGRLVAYKEIAAAIEEIPGVVAHGLVQHPKVTAILANPSGPQVLQQAQKVDSVSE